MANILTGLRIVCSIGLLFMPVLSVKFYILYALAGITDMLDGTIARKTNTASEFGARFDSVADVCFVTGCIIKLVPALKIPKWLWIWLIIITVIKIINIICGFIRHRRLVFEHTVMNKITGFLLFMLPFMLPVIDFTYASVVLSIVAAFSAVQEGYYIAKGKIIV